MKIIQNFLIGIFLLVFSNNVYCAESNIVVQNMTTTQDSIYGTIYSGNFNLPTEIDSLTDIIFAEICFNADIVLPDSNTTIQTGFFALNLDGSANINYVSSNIYSLKKNGVVNFDITEFVDLWKNGDILNNGFLVRKKHSDSNLLNTSFVNFPSGNIAKIRIIYSE
ncbi:MAG: hypothetical protein DWQ06_13605 [Calditrichaeota bacterium]|nr:MAG: hypothetical protein DWQ06_13605 [Calditrichota bacterium]